MVGAARPPFERDVTDVGWEKGYVCKRRTLLLVVVEAAIFIPRREREEGRLREFAREGGGRGVCG